MDLISRKDIDRIAQILSNYINTDESIKLSKILTDAEIIPKLYVYTYFNKVHQELNKLYHDNDRFDLDKVEQLIENLDGLKLSFVNTNNKTDINKLFKFLKNGFKRTNQFCDFNDSKYHGQKKICRCENEVHFEDIEPGEFLSKDDCEAFEKISDAKSWDDAVQKFHDKLNPKTECTPFFMSDEYTKKYNDVPIWTCKKCEEQYEPGDCDFDVSCDMDGI